MRVIDPYYRRFFVRKKRLFWSKVMLFSLLSLLVVILIAYSIQHQEEKQTVGKTTITTPIHQVKKEKSKRVIYANYFRKSGSKHPHKMADAVLSTKKPKLLAAMAVVETKANPTKRKTGYKKRHDGAWQVNPKYWGPVSNDPIKQALQVENILDTLKKRHNDLSAALNKYGGCTKNKYSKLILAELQNVP